VATDGADIGPDHVEKIEDDEERDSR
jgi:hypothetical protein